MTDSPEVVRLAKDRFDAVVDTLSAAFHGYPVMRYILKDAGPDYDDRLAALVGFFTDSRFARDWPVLGVVRGGEILAAANINPRTRQRRHRRSRHATRRCARRLAMARARVSTLSPTCAIGSSRKSPTTISA